MLNSKLSRPVTCDFQQCGILTSVDSDEPVQPPLSLEAPNGVQSIAKQSQNIQVILLPAHPASFGHYSFVSGMQSFYFSESQDAMVLQTCQ